VPAETDELVSNLVAKTGLDAEAITKALGLIIGFLEREDRTQKVAPMIDQIDGARALATAYGGRGGIFILFTELSSAGLGLGEVKTVATEFLDFAKARFGVEQVDQILRAIPALGQFL
jgi:dihydroxyacid dehydratase/phosphogluconate dehydratase